MVTFLLTANWRKSRIGVNRRGTSVSTLSTEPPLTVVGRRAAPYQSPLAVVAGRIDPIMINQTIAALTILRINPPTVARVKRDCLACFF